MLSSLSPGWNSAKSVTNTASLEAGIAADENALTQVGSTYNAAVQSASAARNASYTAADLTANNALLAAGVGQSNADRAANSTLLTAMGGGAGGSEFSGVSDEFVCDAGRAGR